MDTKGGLLLVGGAVLAGVAFAQRSNLLKLGFTLVDASKEALFKASISADAAKYADEILQVSKEVGVDPFIIVALGERETRWGRLASPPGPAGTGDNGHGRGLMQLDDRSIEPPSNVAWLSAHDWTNPLENIRQGVATLKAKLDVLAATGSLRLPLSGGLFKLVSDGTTLQKSKLPDPRPLAGNVLITAAIAAYNTGVENVLNSLAAGKSPDATTTGANYSADVNNTLATSLSKYVNAGGTLTA